MVRHQKLRDIAVARAIINLLSAPNMNFETFLSWLEDLKAESTNHSLTSVDNVESRWGAGGAMELDYILKTVRSIRERYSELLSQEEAQ